MTAVVSASTLERKRRAAIRSRDTGDRHHYFQCVAEARFVLRRVFRIVEEQARAAGLEPLEHQALVQIYGSTGMELQVKQVADRLDISAPFASALLTRLHARGLVSRTRSRADQRVARVRPTAKAIGLLQDIDQRVQTHVAYFTGQLADDQKERAVATLLFYVGLSLREA